jgi:hypothetical protein
MSERDKIEREHAKRRAANLPWTPDELDLVIARLSDRLEEWQRLLGEQHPVSTAIESELSMLSRVAFSLRRHGVTPDLRVVE